LCQKGENFSDHCHRSPTTIDHTRRLIKILDYKQEARYFATTYSLSTIAKIIDCFLGDTIEILLLRLRFEGGEIAGDVFGTTSLSSGLIASIRAFNSTNQDYLCRGDAFTEDTWNDNFVAYFEGPPINFIRSFSVSDYDSC